MKPKLSVVVLALAFLFALTAGPALADCPSGTDNPDYCTPGPPKVVTKAATNVTTNSATLNGSVNPNGRTTTYHFEYGLTTSYGNSTPNGNAGDDYKTRDFSAAISGLQPNTTYHFRIVASNIQGTANGNDLTFTTSATPGQPPAAITDPATGVTVNAATLNGRVNPNGAATTFRFEYGTTTAYGSTTPSGDAGSDSTFHAVSATIGSLQPNTLYHFRVVANNEKGSANGEDRTFTTGNPAVTPPTVTTEPATDITNAGAKLNGTVNPNGAATTYQFEYGTTTSYGTRTTAGDVGSDSTVHPVSTSIVGLMPNTLYHFRTVAKNAGGEVTGQDRTFTTNAAGVPVGNQAAPAVVTLAATGVAATSATLNGTVRPNGLPTQYGFEYGLTTSYGTNTPAQPVPGAADSTDHPVSTPVTGLLPGTTYHYRIVAANSVGLSTGLDMTFTTPAAGQKLKPQLTLKARPKRDKKKPYAYRATGRLVLPAGVSQAQGCVGTVTIKIRRGNRLVGSKAVTLKANCTYNKKVVVTKTPQRIQGRGRRQGKLHIRSYFSGNDVLTTARSPKRTVTYGKKR